MSFSLRSTMLGACALLALMLPSEAQIKAPAPKPLATPDKILLQADEIVYDDERKIVSAVGHVEISDSGRTLMAERVEYDQATDTVTAWPVAALAAT